MWLNPVGTRDLSPCSLCPWVKHCFKWQSVKEPFVRFWSARLFSPTSSLYAKLAKPTSSRLKFYTSHRDLRVVLIVQFNIQHERQFRCFPQISNYTCISIFFFFPVMLFFLLIYPPPVGVFLHGFGVGRCHRLLFFLDPFWKSHQESSWSWPADTESCEEDTCCLCFAICRMTDLFLTSPVVNYLLLTMKIKKDWLQCNQKQ